MHFQINSIKFIYNTLCIQDQIMHIFAFKGIQNYFIMILLNEAKKQGNKYKGLS